MTKLIVAIAITAYLTALTIVFVKAGTSASEGGSDFVSFAWLALGLFMVVAPATFFVTGS